MERLEPPAGPKGATTPSRTRPSEQRSPARALQVHLRPLQVPKLQGQLPPPGRTQRPRLREGWRRFLKPERQRRRRRSCLTFAVQRAQHSAPPGTALPERVLRPAHRSPEVPAGRAHRGAAPRAVESAGSRRSASLQGSPGTTAPTGAGTAFPRRRLQTVRLIRQPHLQTLPQPSPSAFPTPTRSRPTPTPAPALAPAPAPPRLSGPGFSRSWSPLPPATPTTGSTTSLSAQSPEPPICPAVSHFPSGAPARAGGESPQPGAETARGLSGGSGILPGPLWQRWKKRRGEKAASPDESAPPAEKLRCGHPLSWRWAAGVAALGNSGQIPREQRQSWTLRLAEARRGWGQHSPTRSLWGTPCSGLIAGNTWG